MKALDALAAEVGTDYDPFDLVAHVAFGQKPLTRRERAENVKKRNYFARYEGKARAVLEALLEKYADEGLTNLEDPKVLKILDREKLIEAREIKRSESPLPVSALDVVTLGG